MKQQHLTWWIIVSSPTTAPKKRPCTIRWCIFPQIMNNGSRSTVCKVNEIETQNHWYRRTIPMTLRNDFDGFAHMIMLSPMENYFERMFVTGITSNNPFLNHPYKSRLISSILWIKLCPASCPRVVWTKSANIRYGCKAIQSNKWSSSQQWARS